MGPAPLPEQAEDEPARAALAAAAGAAAAAGVAVRTFYRLTHDPAGTILDVARAHDADIVVMEAARGNPLWRALAGDHVSAVQARLPARVSLLLHAA
jgi:nucleotide-binding universal stress UspA family protein